MMGSVQKIRAGIVGMGWAGETHLTSYKALEGIEVVAISDARPEHLAQIADKHGIKATYTDWQDLVKRDDLDVVSIATPNDLHAPVAIAALNSGKHVFTEKPMAKNAAEAEQMVAAAEANQRVLDVAFNHRNRGDVQTLKRIIDSGELGKIYYAKAYWFRRRGVPRWGGWFVDSARSGGGPLIDLGVHMLDMTLYLMGEPDVTTVSASTYNELGPRGRGGGSVESLASFDVEDLATAFIRLRDGSTLTLEASWAGYGHHYDDFGVELFGADGGAYIDNREWKNTDTLRIFTDIAGVPSVVQPRVERGEGHLASVRAFIEAVRQNNWKQHSGRLGLKRSQIIEAAYQSAREGREIAL